MLLVACTPHGAVPERPEEPEPARQADADEAPGRPQSSGGCDHDPPAWLTASVDATLPPLPAAPTGPGIPLGEREAKKHPEVWAALVPNVVGDAPVVDAMACRSQHFLEADLRPVATILYTRDAGTLTARQDSGTDGRIDETRAWTHDVTGALVKLERTRPGRRVCRQHVPAEHEVHHYVYDRFGMHLRTDVDHDADGDIDVVTDWRAIRYDRDGLPILLVKFDTAGQTWLVHRFTWGADARLTEHLLQDASGKLLEAHRSEYDAHGQKRWQADYFDGVGWRTAELQYGSTGELVASEVDANGDCFTDERTLVKYDARGEIVRSTTRVGDDVTAEDEYKYDDAGRLLRFSRSRGTTRNVEFAEHAYDEAGRVTSMRVRQVQGRPPGTHVLEDHATTDYDAEGRVTEQRLARGLFGPEETVVWAHDCRRRYKRFPVIDPRDDPELAHYCIKDFE